MYRVEMPMMLLFGSLHTFVRVPNAISPYFVLWRQTFPWIALSLYNTYIDLLLEMGPTQARPTELHLS